MINKISLFIFALLFIGLVSAVPDLRVYPTNITVNGSGVVNISWIYSTVANQSIINLTGTKEYTLYRSLWFVASTLNVEITEKDVEWLKLNNQSNIVMSTSTSPSSFTINNTKISSWKDSTYNYNYDGRSGITISGKFITVTNSSFLYLGNKTWSSATGSSYGTTWNGGGGIGALVKDNNFTGVYMAIHIPSSGMNNGNITSNIFYNNTFNDIYNSLSTGLVNLTINNNIFDGRNNVIPKHGGIEIINGANKAANWNIINNTFYISNGTIAGAGLIQGNNFRIADNTFQGINTYYEFGMYLLNLANSTIENNRMSLTQYNFYVSNSTNITLKGNYIFNGDIGSQVRNSNQVTFYNNTFKNMTSDIDSYNIGLLIYNTTNTYVTNNIFDEVATIAIQAQGALNTTVTGNTIDFIPLSQRANYKAHDGAEIRCAIKFTQRYKGYFDMPQGNSNVIINGNTYDSDTPCYLVTENTTGLVHDLSDYWYRSFTTSMAISPNNLWTYIIPNYYNNISWYNRIAGSVQYDDRYSYGNRDVSLYISLNLSKDTMWFNNRNDSTNYAVVVNNQYENLIAPNNGTARLCSGNCAFYLTYGNNTYVYNKSILDNRLVAHYKLSEANGTIIYDSTSYANHGTTSGTWLTDGINLTLLVGRDYSILGSVMTILNPAYLYSLMNTSYTYISESAVDYGFHRSIIRIIVGFCGLIAFSVAVFYVYKLFVEVNR